MSIHFFICCRSGVLCQGACRDFLGAILLARREKSRCSALLPNSVFRVQIRYANGSRVPSDDLKAAFRALADVAVLTQVSNRLFSGSGAPRAAIASTERTALENGFLAVAVDAAFCQAGVVAPPDSPDLGNSLEIPVDLFEG